MGIGSFLSTFPLQKMNKLHNSLIKKNNIQKQCVCLPVAVLLAKCVCFVCVEDSIVYLVRPMFSVLNCQRNELFALIEHRGRKGL